MAKSKTEIFAEGLVRTIERYRNLNEGEKYDGIEIADNLCNDLDRPIDIIPVLESLVRNSTWTRAVREGQRPTSPIPTV